jgi:alanine racemase
MITGWMTSRSPQQPLHTRHSRVIIDLAAIRSNYRFLKTTAPNSRVIAVIKADAYGHGAIEVARTLADADAFAVATSLEAIPLREAGISQKIVVLGGVVNEAEMQSCFDYQLDPVLHQFWQIDLMNRMQSRHKIDLWLKFNSGMGRLGFSEPDLRQALSQLKQSTNIDTIRLMTHLANADDNSDPKSSEQISSVKGLGLQGYEWGIANSAGILGWPKSHVNWVRAGIALYGSDPFFDPDTTSKLRPAMNFKSQLLAINSIKKGHSIGYGGLHTCQRDQTIGVVAAGYADGYPRHLTGGYVMINGHKAAIVGRVSMDMITIDLSGLQAKPGDEVTLWGDAPLANEIASLSETISYELFCHAGCHGRKEFINKN